MAIADEIRFICWKSRISQERLAEAADVSQATISRFLAGDLDVSLDVIAALAEACGYQLKVQRVVKRKPPTNPRARNPLWDAVERIWFPSGVSKRQAARVGRLVSELNAVGATTDEIRKRWERCQAESPELMWGPEGFVKQWEQFEQTRWENRQGERRRQKGPGRVHSGASASPSRPPDFGPAD